MQTLQTCRPCRPLSIYDLKLKKRDIKAKVCKVCRSVRIAVMVTQYMGWIMSKCTKIDKCPLLIQGHP